MTVTIESPVFHVTQVIDTLESAFDSHRRLFYRPVAYVGYWDVVERSAIATFVGDVVVEGMVPHRRQDGSVSFASQDLAPFVESPGGGHLHSLAWYVKDINDLAARLRSRGVRFVDSYGHDIKGEVPTHGPIPVVPGSRTRYPPGWVSAVLYTYFDDTPGMLEFCEPSSYHPGMGGRRSGAPRKVEVDPDTPIQGLHEEDPLGIERMSHLSVVVPELSSAREFFVEVLDGRQVAEGESEAIGARTVTVILGDGQGTVLELAEPIADGIAKQDLERFGHGVLHRCTFKVKDLDAVRMHLASENFRIEVDAESTLVVDPVGTSGSRFGFTTATVAAR